MVIVLAPEQDALRGQSDFAAYLAAHQVVVAGEDFDGDAMLAQGGEFLPHDFTLERLLDFDQQMLVGEGLGEVAAEPRRLAARHHELDPAERHRMRICFKKLRYAVEFFTPLLPTKRLKPYLQALSRLQDELGLINDHVTAQTLLDEALQSRPAGPIHGWIAGRHALLVSELPEALEIWLGQKAAWK